MNFRALAFLSGLFALATHAVGTEAAELPPPCSTSALDSNVFASGLGHDSFDSSFRRPFGAVKTDQGSIELKFRSCRNDVERVRVRIWNSVTRTESWLPMTREPNSGQDPMLGPVDFWSVSLSVPRSPTILYYFFETTDGTATRYYVDDPAVHEGGWGRYSHVWDDQHSYQITVYDKKFAVPDWLKGGVVYQIFPDRYRNGNTANDPAHGSGFVLGKPVRKLGWKDPICDPRGSECPDEYGNQFYGGDLQGIIEKLDEIKKLGVNAIYLNPIFMAGTNHRYDTQDYMKIDSELGDLETFRLLAKEARARGIRLILDGVFNHVSADSPYFDYFGRWKGLGACQSANSPYRSWFFIPHVHNAALDEMGNSVFCKGYRGEPVTYESWWGYYELPVLNRHHPSVKGLFYTRGKESVGPYWLSEDAGGWRLDVGGDIDHGQASDPQNRFWEEFRTAVKAQDPTSVIIGEEWGDASPWLTGWEWDSVMNYRFRGALFDWLSDGCTGLGCQGGVIFEDNDNRSDRVNGPISPINESIFDARLKGIQEDYPPEAWHAMLNLLGSHDTNRVLFILKKISRDDAQLAKRKLLLATLLQYTYPGAPMTYYGDEVGVAPDAKWAEDRWLDDPYNRIVYPWSDQGLSGDQLLLRHFQKMGQLRNAHPALQRGDFETVHVDDTRRIYAFRRSDRTEDAWVVLNRSQSKSDVTLSVPAQFEGAVLEDVLNGGTFKVMNGKLNANAIEPLWGRILVKKATTRYRGKSALISASRRTSSTPEGQQ